MHTLFTLAFLFLVLIPSCTACSDATDCAVNAACAEATCVCNAGFSGSGVDSSEFYRLDPPYSAHRYSSTLFGAGPGGRYARGRYAETSETWVSSGNPAWMQIDLGEQLTIAGLDINGGNNVLGWPQQIRVEVSPDGQSARELVEGGRNFPGGGAADAESKTDV
eukprot:1874321-Rhodomonas_salina.1